MGVMNTKMENNLLYRSYIPKNVFGRESKSRQIKVSIVWSVFFVGFQKGLMLLEDKCSVEHYRVSCFLPFCLYNSLSHIFSPY